MSGFGKVNLDDSYEGFKYFKLKTPDIRKGETETELILRLLPSMHSYRDSGEWKFFYGQHYGHYGNNPKQPDKPRARPFGCIQQKNPKTGEIEVECPKCTQIEKKKAAKKAREEQLLKQLQAQDASIDEKSPEFKEAKADDKKLQDLNAWLMKHNCDKKWWMNVMDLKGEFGVFQLSYTTMKERLLPLLRDLRDKKKIDAFDPAKGVFLRFTRSGKGINVVDNVTVYTETVVVEGEELQKMKFAPLTDEQIEKALKICPDLKKDVVKFISAKQIAELVERGDDPDAVDEIWPPENAQVKTEVKDDSDDEEAELERLLAEKKAAKAAKAIKAKTEDKPTKTVETPEDFLAQFAVK
jgi:hypothetical protein